VPVIIGAISGIMDLKEFNHNQPNRHPWETARLKALCKILRPHLFNGIRILDVGCGDGFISRGLFGHLQSKEITAVDINLSDSQLLEFNNFSSGFRYTKELPADGTFDIVLLLDVLEHVQDDISFLSEIVNRYISLGAKVLITVPAFQSLYGHHDVFLGHYRRYRLQELESLGMAGGLKVLSSGYLFATLLIPKYILFKLLDTGRSADGVGKWHGGRIMTCMFEKILNVDNNILISLSRLGIKLPGLTGWVLCEKQE